METLVPAALAALALIVLAGLPTGRGMPAGMTYLNWKDIGPDDHSVACGVHVNYDKRLQVYQASCREGVHGSVHMIEDQEYQCRGMRLTIPHPMGDVDIDAGCVLVRVRRQTMEAQLYATD